MRFLRVPYPRIVRGYYQLKFSSMAEQDKLNIRDFELDKINAYGIINEEKLQKVINQLKILKDMIDEMTLARDQSEVPRFLFNRITDFETALREYIIRLEDKPVNTSDDLVTRKKDQLIQEINSFYQNSINLQNSSSNKLIEFYTIVKAFRKTENKSINELNSIKEEFNKSLKDSFNLTEELKSKVNDSDAILNELKKKTSEQTVSDYAVVFETEASTYKNIAKRWLITGIIMSLIFMATVILIASFNFLSTEVYNETGEFIRYNFTNLASKLFLIALQIFLISFSFKQFNINNHLKTLNQHRLNALNSYKLFTRSIVGDDHTSRNALMVQVAKAIYEHSQSTGYLNDRNQVNSGIIELTKIIGESKTV